MRRMGFIIEKETTPVSNNSLIVTKDYTHSCSIGQTGSGKTSCYIYPNLEQRIKDGDSILFFDYKGKEHQAVKYFAKENGRFNDIIEIGKDWGKSINLLKYMSKSDLEDFIKSMLSMEKNNEYWSRSGANISVSILSIISDYDKFITSVENHKKCEELFKYCLKNDSLRNTPRSKTLYSLYEIIKSTESVKEFHLNMSNFTEEFTDGLKEIAKNLNITNSLKNITKELFILQKKLNDNLKCLATFQQKTGSSNHESLINSINKPIATLSLKKSLNDDSFDVIEALNQNKIVIINTQEFSDSALSYFSNSLFKEFEKRTNQMMDNSISVFIDEAQRVISNEYDLPLDVLREARVELFLAFQNEELMVEKLGLNKYKSLSKNITRKFQFKNITSNAVKKAVPIFLDKNILFSLELEYQKKLNIFKKYDINKSIKNMILIHDSKLFENNQMLLVDINNKTKIVEIKEKVDEIELKAFYDSIFLVVEMEKYYLEGFEDLREQLMANKF
jgi:hypothetical protein